ncbi:MAG: hypothetical protein M3O90_09750 [Actinomycetota bacterium]|nr:hypothetical protein [Actinomycetota bacterium]
MEHYALVIGGALVTSSTQPYRNLMHSETDTGEATTWPASHRLKAYPRVGDCGAGPRAAAAAGGGIVAAILADRAFCALSFAGPVRTVRRAMAI